VHTSGFGSYKQLLPVFALMAILSNLIVVSGIMLAMATGKDNIFSAPEFSGGGNGKTWGHVAGHLIAMVVVPIVFWGIGSLIMLLTKTNLLSMEGRLNRAAYFGRALAISAVMMLIGAAMGATMGQDAAREPAGGVGLAGTVVIAFQAVKRLHDLDRPGTHYWLLLVPFYNIYLSLILLFKKGTDGSNRYGPDPLAPRSVLVPVR
jgi:uncharacterized membrane protein YhaH (DUF805 family)